MSCGIKKTPFVQPWKLDVFCLPVHSGAVPPGCAWLWGRVVGSLLSQKRGSFSPHASQSCCFSCLHAKPCSHSPQPWWDPELHLWGTQGCPGLPMPSPRDLQAPWGWWSQMYVFIFSSELLFVFCTLTWVGNYWFSQYFWGCPAPHRKWLKSMAE